MHKTYVKKHMLNHESGTMGLTYIIRGVFGKYVDKCNKMCIKYTRRIEFCIKEYQLFKIKYNQYEKRTPIDDLDISH